MPADLVTILAKDEDKQKAIVEKSAKDAEDRKARAIGQTHPPAPLPGGDLLKQSGAPVATAAASKAPAMNRASAIQAIPPFKGGMTASSSTKVPGIDASKLPSQVNNANVVTTGLTAAASMSKVPEKEPAGAANARLKRIQMMVPKIPPFDPSKRRVMTNGAEASGSSGSMGSSAAAGGSGGATPVSPTTAAAPKLNAGASSFKPNPNASAFKPVGCLCSVSRFKVMLNLVDHPQGSSASSSNAPSVKPAAAPVPETSTAPNPYFGTRLIKKGTPVHIKDDFNPFKYAKVSEASAIRKFIRPTLSECGEHSFIIEHPF